MIYIYTKGSYLRRSCNKDTENAKYPSPDSITDTRRCEIIFRGQFFALFIMACIGAFAPTVITTTLDLIWHSFNLL